MWLVRHLLEMTDKRTPILLTLPFVRVCQKQAMWEWKACQVWFFFFPLSGWLKRSCTLADDLIRSPSLLQPLWFRQKARVCLLLFLFNDGSNVIMSSSFLISAPYVPCVSLCIECQRCHNGHSVAVEIPALLAGNNMYSAPKPGWRFGTLLGR